MASIEQLTNSESAENEPFFPGTEYDDEVDDDNVDEKVQALLESQFEKTRDLLIWDTKRRGLVPLTESELNSRNLGASPLLRWWV